MVHNFNKNTKEKQNLKKTDSALSKNRTTTLKNNSEGLQAQSFRIKLPHLWIFLAIMIVYGSSIQFGLTHLDDKIFILENSGYNKDMHNILHSFHRGVFSEENDTYYRPILLISYILEYPLHAQNPQGYHLVNLLLHIACCFLVLKLLQQLLKNHLHAFFLTMIFAVHPVLSQAVVWIPGRNDTLLMLFLASFFISYLQFIERKKPLYYILQLLFLGLALFTKESALAAPIMAVMITVYVLKKGWQIKNHLFLFAGWIPTFALWYFLRHASTLHAGHHTIHSYWNAFIYHLPVLVQYIGKIFFPFNLSVFAMQEDTVYVYGLAAILLFIGITALAKNKNIHIIIFGACWFAAFMLPALFVPKGLNDQVFEHRLYIPILGIFLMLSQSVLFLNRFKAKTMLMGVMVLVLLLGIGSHSHAKLFKDEITFWESATETSPHSSYAAMLLGVKYYFKDRKADAEKMIRKSYALNPRERYTNHYMGKLLLEKDSFVAAEKYFKKETEISNFNESWFELAHIAFIKNDLKGAEKALSKAALLMQSDPTIHSNLLLLYIDLKEYEKAEIQLKRMKTNGLPIPARAEERLKKEKNLKSI